MRKLANYINMILWGLFTVNLTTLLYFEKVVFENYFREVGDFIFLGLGALTLILLISFIGKKIPFKILKMLIFTFLIWNAFLWLLITSNLPIEQSEIGCVAIICGKLGQSQLLFINYGLLVPLLVELTQRSNSINKENLIKYSILLMSTIILIVGILIGYADFDYYWGPIFNIPISILMALSVLYIKNESNTVNDDKEEKLFVINIFSWVIYLIWLVVLLIFGFSMMDNNIFLYDLLFAHIGIGGLIYYGLFFGLSKFMKEPNLSRFMEGLILFIMLISWEIMAQLASYGDGEIIPLSIGHTPFIIGIIYGYFWQRIYMYVSGQSNNETKNGIKLRIPVSLGEKIAVGISLLAFFVITIVNMSVGFWDLGLIIIVIDLILWLIYIKKLKLNEKK